MAAAPLGNNVLRLISERGDEPPQEPSGLPTIRIRAGELPRIIDEAEAALVAAGGHDIYRFGNALVKVAWDRIRVAGGGHDESLRHSPIGVAGLMEIFPRVAGFVRWLKTENAWAAADCPEQVAKSYLARDGEWNVPPLLGVITAPTLRPDGTVISTRGYDKETGLLFDPLGVDFGGITTHPTREDAEGGLRMLKQLIRRFSFVSPADRSVALSGIITAVVRQAIPVAPMHAFDAPVPGSGKSLLVDLAAMIATGHRAAVMSTGTDKYGDAEFEKRLSSAVLGGDVIVSMDNMEEPLNGQLLCQVLTQHSVKIRPFGKLQNVTVPSTATYFANGNNLVVLGDLTRRVLVGRIDPRVERPELVRHPFAPVALARRARVILVRAVLAIVMAHQQSGAERGDPLGSFEEWSWLVRDALVWLGEADPVEVMERTRAADPRLETLRAVVRAWRDAFEGVQVRVKDIMAMVNEIRSPDGTSSCANPDLREAILPFAAGSRGDLSPEKIGRWLRRNLDRTLIIDEVKYRFVNEADTNGTKWRLEYDKRAVPTTVSEDDGGDAFDVPF